MNLPAFEEEILGLLRRLTDGIESIAQSLSQIEVESEAPAPTGCQHPADQRINFAGMGEPDDWQCKVCGYRHEPVAVGAV